MKRIIAMALVALFTVGAVRAQHCGHHGQGQHCGRHMQQAPKTQYNADGIQMDIVAAFPKVKSVKKTDKWTEVYDAQGKLLGYAIYSQPASNGIKGYAGETPVMIALDLKKKITGVYLLPCFESPNYVQHVREAGFFDQWNGLSIKQAKKKKVDTVSGATFTSRAVVESVQAVLNKF